MLQSTNRAQHPLDRPIGRGRSDVSLSAFAYLFSELVQYHQNRVLSIQDLELRLEQAGRDVGARCFEILSFREIEGGRGGVGGGRGMKRETRILGILQFISTTLWRSLFSKPATSLEKSMDSDQEFMIHDASPPTNMYVSLPPDLGGLNTASYISGIVEGVLNSSGFDAKVTAHTVKGGSGGGLDTEDGNNGGNGGNGGGYVRDKTVFLVRFTKEVMERDAALER